MEPLRLAPEAARAIRAEIERAGGREVCFLASVDGARQIVNPRAVARGNRHAVLAAASGASAGEILLHNHPSGELEPSDPDLALAARVYEEGLGTGIIDNGATRLYVVVEPPEPRERVRLDPAEVTAALAPGGALAARHPGFEDRPSQRAMATRVTERYNEGGVLVVEAGTGTGKSLAYLLPAAHWALANGERTVVSTNTINLQEQLVGKDLPLVQSLVDGELRWALVKGRGNYVSIRRLLLAAETAPLLFENDRAAELEALVEWSENTRDGSLSDLATAPSPEVWEEVRSDGDICLKARCPHFQACFYQRARRKAASADILVANHALLLSDVALRETTDNWAQSAVLPPYRHVVLDEAHNVEDAATQHLGAEVTRIGLLRTLGRIERKDRGVVSSIAEILRGAGEGGEASRTLLRIQDRLRPLLKRARTSLAGFFDLLEPRVPSGTDDPLRLGRGDPRDPGEDPEVIAALDRLTAALGRLEREVEELRLRLEGDEVVRERLEGRLLDLRSLERRLEGARHGLSLVLDPGERESAFVRWIEGEWRDGILRNVRLAAAPVEPGQRLRAALFERVEAAVLTSATLSVGRGGFGFVRGRLGLDASDPAPPVQEAEHPAFELAFADPTPVIDLSAEAAPPPLEVVEEVVASPFRYEEQALFAVPTDLPDAGAAPAFQAATARVTLELAAMTGGGIFVLFTSYRAMRDVAHRLRQSGEEGRRPLLVQGEAPRHRLLADFIRSERAILLGTTSFWEGVDVPGEPLRGLIIQKLPFRVPSEPVTQARMEALEARGKSPFNGYLLPLAALRLKQGFGRLIRARSDRGAILLLDHRILTKGYGRLLLGALPPAPLVKGPWEELRTSLRAFYGEPACSPGPDG